MPAIRVLIVEDQELVRDGLASVLDRECDIDVVGTAATAEQALPVLRRLRPEVAVIDYGLPRMTGVELCEQVTAELPGIAVIVITNYMEEGLVVRAMRAGAKAFAYKDVRAEELRRAIRAVAAGETVLDPRASRRVFEWAKQGRIRREGTLSQREVEVLRLASAGKTNSEIADTLGLTENTVRTYVKRTFEKLGCRNRTEAAAQAARRGLL